MTYTENGNFFIGAIRIIERNNWKVEYHEMKISERFRIWSFNAILCYFELKINQHFVAILFWKGKSFLSLSICKRLNGRRLKLTHIICTYIIFAFLWEQLEFCFCFCPSLLNVMYDPKLRPHTKHTRNIIL